MSQDNLDKIICGDSLEVLKTFESESVDCIITSPPYWGLRDYGVEGQLGLEKTPEEYVIKLVEIFREAKRVLKNEGTLWLNLGDSYSTPKEGNTETNKNKTRVTDSFKKELPPGMKPKNLVGIPWRVAFTLQADGWYLRQDIIWAKPNPMPESVTDRCTKSHEYIFLLTKSPKYYFDNEAIREPQAEVSKERAKYGWDPKHPNGVGVAVEAKHYDDMSQFVPSDGMRNKRSVWTVTTKPYAEAHFATFPQDLIIPMIKAGCPEQVCKKCGKARERITEKGELENEREPRADNLNVIPGRDKVSRLNSKNMETLPKTFIGLTDCGCNAGFTGGVVMDVFMGSGTTAITARTLGRHYLGIELNESYIKLAEDRLSQKVLF